LESLSETCHKLKSFTHDNYQLFKDIYSTYLVSVHLGGRVNHLLTCIGYSS
jgi:hypothetical protein